MKQLMKQLMKQRSSSPASSLVGVPVLCGALLAVLLAPPLQATGASRIKLATISPENAPYVKYVKDMGEAWERDSQGRVTLVIYAGGQAGDEADIVRKMRIDQYHASALSIVGLYAIDEYFHVFQIPFFFDSYEEMLHVLRAASPLLEARLEKKGFVHLSWGYIGWVHIFTKKPVRTVEDLKSQKIFTWAGDDAMVRWYRRNGFQPVALSFPDIFTGLETGMIDAVPAPPLAAMQLNYFRQAPHMLDLGLAPMIGALLITRRAWERIDEADREKMLEASAQAEEKFFAQIPKLDEAAIKMMGTQGLTLSEVKDKGGPQWAEAAEAFARDMGGGLVPQEIFDLAVEARTAFRASRSAAGSE